jgi:hypothetical protein
MKIKYFYIVMFIAIPALGMAQDNSQTVPCSLSESSQFDFWIGEWDLSWQDSEGKTQTAKNVVSRILGGYAVQENFSTSDGTFSGKSFSVYNANKGVWEQTWVDNSGAYITFTGGMDVDKMTLSREVMTKEGKKVIQRMVFYDISKNNITWDWESSSDEGATWKLQWRLNYKRVQ